jgi:hypothetical protein
MDVLAPVLRREVVRPPRRSSSFGLIVVSSLAMVFAISSSLLLYSAHQQRRLHYSRIAAPPPTPVEVETPPARAETIRVTPAADCKPTYRHEPDGTVTVTFETCAPRRFAAP